MSSDAPQIDPRVHADFLEEAVSAVHTVLPGWSGGPDAGHALLSVCASMAEKLSGRLNRLPERARLEVLRRAGVRPRPASAARGELAFTTTADGIRIPLGTLAGTPGDHDIEPVLFSVTRTTPLSGPSALLASGTFLEYPAAGLDASGVLLPFGGWPETASPVPGPGHPESPLLFIYAHPLTSATVSLMFEIEGARRTQPEQEYQWECCSAAAQPWGTGPAWQSCQVLRDTTGGFTRSGTVELRLPDQRPAARIRITEVTAPAGRLEGPTSPGRRPRLLVCERTQLIRCRPRWPAPTRRILPIRRAQAQETVAAVQGRLTGWQDLGRSSGLANQRFALSEPALSQDWPPSVEVTVDGTPQTWTFVPSWDASLPTDLHFTIDLNTNEAVFGACARIQHTTRQYGAIPPRGALIRIAPYLTGGGRIGNVAENNITILHNDLAHVTAVTNPGAFTGGADGEAPDAAAARMPLGAAPPERAVTDADYERLAPHTRTGVARALAVRAESIDALYPALGCSAAAPARSQAHISMPPAAPGIDLELPAGTSYQPTPSAGRDPIEFRTLHPVLLARNLGVALHSEGIPGPWLPGDAPQRPALRLAPPGIALVTAIPHGFPLTSCILTFLLAPQPDAPDGTTALSDAEPTLNLMAHLAPGAAHSRQEIRLKPLTATAPGGQDTTNSPVAFSVPLGTLAQWHHALCRPLATDRADAFADDLTLADLGYPPHAAAWLTCNLSNLPGPALLQGVQVHTTSVTVPSEQTTLIPAGTPLDPITGSPGQLLRIPPPARGETPALTLTHDDGTTHTWHSVPSFAASTPHDRHIVINPASGEVHFGPSLTDCHGHTHQYGATPPVGATATIARPYRTTLGAHGNLPTDSPPQELPTHPDIRITNGPATAGTDAADRRHRQLPPSIRTVGLLIVPHTTTDPAAFLHPRDLCPTDEVIRALRTELQRLSPAAVPLDIAGPGYLYIGIQATITPRAGSDTGQLPARITTALYRYFNPLIGGPDGAGWPFGRPVHTGDALRTIERVDGVAGLQQLTMHLVMPPEEKECEAHEEDARWGDWGDPQELITLTPEQTIASAPHEITIELQP